MAKQDSNAPIATIRKAKTVPPEVQAALEALELAKHQAAERIKGEKREALQMKAKELNDRLDKIDAELALLQ